MTFERSRKTGINWPAGHLLDRRPSFLSLGENRQPRVKSLRVAESEIEIQSIDSFHIFGCQIEISAVQVLLHPLRFYRFRDHNQALLGGPSKKDLGGRFAVRFGDFSDGGVGEQVFDLLDGRNVEFNPAVGAKETKTKTMQI